MRILLLTSLVGFLFFIPACKSKKDQCEGLICDFGAYTFRLTMQDKTTGVDYFFSPNPKYPYSALKISSLDSNLSKYLTMIPDTLSDQHSFIFQPFSFGAAYLLSLNNGTPDTLRFTGETHRTGCCGSAINFYDITLNRQSIFTDFNNRVLTIKK